MFDIGINILESLTIALALLNYAEVRNKHHKILHIVGLTLLHLIEISVFNYLFVYEGLFTFVIILSNLLYVKLVSDSSWEDILLSTLIVSIFISIANQTALWIVSALYKIRISDIFNNSAILQQAVILSKIFFPILCAILVRTRKRTDELMSKYASMFIIIFAISLLIITFLENAIYHEEYNNFALSLTSYLLLVIDVISIYLLYIFNKESIRNLNNAFMQRELNLMEDVFDQFEKSNETISIIKHDLGNKMVIIDGYLQNSKYKEAMEYIKDISKHLKESNILIRTGSIPLDCVLNSKVYRAKESGKTIVTMLDRSAMKVIDEADLAILIANALDNAIENAALNSQFIELEIKREEETLFLCIQNQTDIDVLSSNPDLNSTKADSSAHGFGIKSIRRIAAKYKGTVHFMQIKDTFQCLVYIPIFKR